MKYTWKWLPPNKKGSVRFEYTNYRLRTHWFNRQPKIKIAIYYSLKNTFAMIYVNTDIVRDKKVFDYSNWNLKVQPFFVFPTATANVSIVYVQY